MNRIVIDRVSPMIDEGRHPAKGVMGEPFRVDAVLLCDGHEELRGDLLVRRGKRGFKRIPLQSLGNDIWRGAFTPDELGIYEYTIEASLDEFAKYRKETLAKARAEVLEKNDLEEGVLLFQEWAKQSRGAQARLWSEVARKISALSPGKAAAEIAELLSEPHLQEAARAIPHRSLIRFPKVLSVFVDPPVAGTGAWYEFFPRSFGPGGKHGSFRSAEPMLEYAADLGFDVVYLPPIHPIGVPKRKGKNNSLEHRPEDVGSPWAIADHKAIHPELGTFEDFARFQEKAGKLGLKIALDVAFQCAPDHPYLRAKPEWFKKRADGAIQYAENPPKKYEDIYPFDFYGPDHQKLWEELKSIFIFWLKRGVQIFRVDNPHTKPFPFWEWLIREVKTEYPEAVFLSEAFTRPHIMRYLAKIGFSQSYTYFTWRLNKQELTEYAAELSTPESKAFFRPNFWPNTPDILSGPLRNGNSADFQIRFLLAATLSANYGIYGPAFELLEGSPRDTVSEEYLNSEKYELKAWDLASPDSIAPLIRRVNRLRREYPALVRGDLHFLETTNENLMAYLRDGGGSHLYLVVVNLNPAKAEIGSVCFDRYGGGGQEDAFTVQDLLTDTAYPWHGDEHYIELHPERQCAHIFRIARKADEAGESK